MSTPIRVRFAPSPTGYLHVGGARTALYNYLFARHHGGQFVLRVEDTDEERSTEEALRMQLEDLAWLGLEWDEGPDLKTLADKGEKGPYRQSCRKPMYAEYAQRLIDDGRAYYCFLTDEEITQQRDDAAKAGKPLQINSPYRDMSLEEAKAKLAQGDSATVRFRTPDGQDSYSFEDLVRGQVTLPAEMVSDFVILRSGGMPVYNFCCSIDDALMGITHVFRAEEHLNNTLRQMMIYEALGFSLPRFGHLSIILGEDKQKLSKRHGATSVHEYKNGGYLKEALLNFVTLLGWSHPEEKEIFPLAEAVEQFTTDRLKSAPAVFDTKKFQWMNSQYIKAMDTKDLWEMVAPRLAAAGVLVPADSSWQLETLEVFKERMTTLEDCVDLYRPLVEFSVDATAADAMGWDSSSGVFNTWRSALSDLPDDHLSEEQFSSLQNLVKENCGVKGKHLFMPIRVAVIGKPQGADLKVLVPLIAREELIRRVDKVLEAL